MNEAIVLPSLLKTSLVFFSINNSALANQKYSAA